jgi:hypothetical protein
VEILISADCTWPSLPRLDTLHTAEHSQLVQHASRLERQVAELQNRLQSQQRNEVCTHEVVPHSISPVDCHGELSTDVVLLSMNAAAEPSFVGATSGFSLSRLVEGILSQSMVTERARGNATTISDETIPEHSPAPDQEDVLIDTFFQRVHPRYPLLDEVSLQNLFRERTSDEDHNAPDLFLLYMVCAIAARTIQLHPEMRRCTSPEVCHITGSEETMFDSKMRVDILYTCSSLYRFCSSEPEPTTGTSSPINCHIPSPNPK